jgi:hypothetical protein
MEPNRLPTSASGSMKRVASTSNATASATESSPPMASHAPVTSAIVKPSCTTPT